MLVIKMAQEVSYIIDTTYMYVHLYLPAMRFYSEVKSITSSSSLSLLNIDRKSKLPESLNVLLSGDKGMTSVVGRLRGQRSSSPAAVGRVGLSS